MNTILQRISSMLPRIGVLGAILISGCSALNPLSAPSVTRYALVDAAGTAPAAAPPGPAGLTLLVNPPQASAGFDSQRMVYLRQPEKAEFFSESEWVDTPGRMLAPLLVASLARSGGFRAVVQGPGAFAADLRLNVQVLRLQQEFFGGPSRVRFAVRAYLVDDATRKVLATRDFEAVANASGENAAGGAQAANQAVQSVLAELAAFCAQTAREAPRS